MSQQTGRYEAALPLAEDAAAIYRSLGDRRGEAEALDQSRHGPPAGGTIP